MNSFFGSSTNGHNLSFIKLERLTLKSQDHNFIIKTDLRLK